MTPERWQQIEDVFQTAFDLPIAEREKFLDGMCRNDPELRREVETLLAQNGGSFNPISSIVSSAVDLFQESELQEAVGSQIGPYRLAGIIGQGGMGIVYKAVRNDDEYQKVVALKVVRQGMGSQFIINRFRKERQILAGLDHPNIARLLDGGTTDEGLPYFVMEYIEGATIVEFCNVHALQLPDRLKLFQQVCSAIQYAHQKLVIHRDIKPSNILISQDGTPKLLDFGIAKLLSQDSSAPSLTETMTILKIMTPDYASPEQVRGISISTASDIYSLGAVLYEMLTGLRPHQFKSYTPTEIERVVCSADPEKPRSAAQHSPDIPHKLARQLTEDIDNIVLMAMRKEPERRYQSAAQLSDDIGRYMQRLPVMARPDTLVYRAGKFVRRNKLAVVSVVLIMLTLVGGIVAANYQARRAERRFQEVRKLANTFLFQFHDKIKDLPGSTEAREMIVQTALEYLDSLSKESGNDSSLQTELAEAYLKVGDVQGDPRSHNLGHPDAAMKSYQKALTLLQPLAVKEPENTQILRSLATSYYKVGDLEVEMGNINGGMKALHQATVAADRDFASHPNNEQDLLLLIRSLRLMGDAQLKLRDPVAALSTHKRATELSERMVKMFPSDLSLYHLTLSLTRVGDDQAETGDLTAAIETYKKNSDIREGLVRRNPADATYRREWRHSQTWLGNYAGGLDTFNLGDRQTALEYYDKALSIAQELAAADPKNAIFTNDLSICYSKVGDMLLDSDPNRALALYQKAQKINDGLLASSPKEYRFLSRQSLFSRNIGLAFRNSGNSDEAVQSLRKSLLTLEKMGRINPNNPETDAGLFSTRLALAQTLLIKGDYPAALSEYQQALRIAEKTSSANANDLYAKWRLADSYLALGLYYQTLASQKKDSTELRTENWSQARSCYQKCYDIWNNWPSQAVSTVFDKTRKQQTARSIENCDQQLAGLESASLVSQKQQ